MPVCDVVAILLSVLSIYGIYLAVRAFLEPARKMLGKEKDRGDQTERDDDLKK